MIAGKSIMVKAGPERTKYGKQKSKIADEDRVFGTVDVTEAKGFRSLFPETDSPQGSYPFVLLFSNYGKSFFHYDRKLKAEDVFHFMEDRLKDD